MKVDGKVLEGLQFLGHLTENTLDSEPTQKRVQTSCRLTMQESVVFVENTSPKRILGDILVYVAPASEFGE